tara:strand:+ start:161 stop:460 length:300 start_codon:yes stop_codon:yes gene_type:complete
MDLHDLIVEYGSDNVAAVMCVTERQLVELRRGASAITVDDLFELDRAFPAFDMRAAVRRIGEKRDEKQVSRKHRKSKRGCTWKENPKAASAARRKGGEG